MPAEPHEACPAVRGRRDGVAPGTLARVATSRRLIVAVLGIVVFLIACSTGSPVPGAAEPENCPIDASADAFGHARFVPGDIIVRFTSVSPSAIDVPGDAPGRRIALEKMGGLGIPDAALYRAPGLGAADTLRAVASLERRPGVAYAHPNYVVSALLEPNDPQYGPIQMWHYPDIRLPEAWDVTTGDQAIAVAVLDTGMLMEHPDRPTTMTDGYDFVSCPENLDGDGRDPDPRDPGPASETNYHGSHVAGTVTAATDNETGIAGASWASTLVPVRVLGPEGTLADLIPAIAWAAGDTVDGVPDNPRPARVLNLSIGGTFECSGGLQDAVDRARQRGSVVVAAAGNAGTDAAGTAPANCHGVVAVGATTLHGNRADYSNWGSTIDVMAPGGDLLDGVLSLYRNDGTGNYSYRDLTGTSMAAAHVSGVAALMLAINPSLTPDDVAQILTATADALGEAECDGGDASVILTGADCGAGKIDAYAAVTTAQGW